LFDSTISGDIKIAKTVPMLLKPAVALSYA